MVNAETSATETRSGGLSSATQTSSSGAQAQRRASRHVLSDDQKREVARLYSETTTPLPEIRKRFGIAESSLYRLIQQRGITLRGRTKFGVWIRNWSSASRLCSGHRREVRHMSIWRLPESGGRARTTMAIPPSFSLD